MKSEFEKSAAYEAVKAVEERWRRQHRQEVRQARRKRFNNWFFGLLFVFIVAAGGLAVWRYFGGETMADLGPISGWLSNVKSLATVVGRGEASNRAVYCEKLRQIVSRPIRPLKELPPELRPKKAPAGTTYLALACDKTNDLRVFRLTADGKGVLSASELSPFSPERALSWPDFRKNCPAPYLISVGDCVYLNGSKDLKDGVAIVTRVKSVLGTD